MPFTNKQVGKNAIRIRREQHLISKWGQNISEFKFEFPRLQQADILGSN